MSPFPTPAPALRISKSPRGWKDCGRFGFRCLASYSLAKSFSLISLTVVSSLVYSITGCPGNDSSSLNLHSLHLPRDPPLSYSHAESRTLGSSCMNFSVWGTFDPTLTFLAPSLNPLLWDCPPITGCFNVYFCFKSITRAYLNTWRHRKAWREGKGKHSGVTLLVFWNTFFLCFPYALKI